MDGLGGADHQLLRVLSEDLLDGPGLGDVAELGRGAVGVDVVDLGGVHARPLERLAHGADRAQALGMGGGEVVHVGGGAIAGDLGEDLGAAALGELHVLQHQHHAALPHHEAVAIEVERPAGLLGLVVALAHRFDLAEGAHGQGSDRGLRAAGEHGSRLTPLDDLGRFPDAVAGGGAGADDRVVRAPGAGVDRHQARGHVADHHRHREGRDAAHPPLQQRGVVLLDLLHASDARGDDDADVVGVELGRVEVRVLKGLLGGGQGELAEAAHVAGRLAVHVPLGVEVLDLSRDPGRVAGGVETGDRANPRGTLDHARPH